MLAATLLAGVTHAAENLRLTTSAERVGTYEKIEFRLDAPATYRNPFDPDEVDLAVVIEGPGGRHVSVPAFWCQDYERRRLARSGRETDWFYPRGMPAWKARFTPAEPGAYRAWARLKDRSGEHRSQPIEFQCTASGRHGFLRTSAKDPRFLEFDDGTPFFAIGQNLAFIGPQQYVDLGKAEAIFARLKENGANFLRVWPCCEDWAMAIEARKSAFGRSWAWKPPIVDLPDGKGGTEKCLKLPAGGSLDVSPSQPVALRPNTRYVVAGRIKAEARTALRVAVGQSSLEQPIEPGPNQGWIQFRQEFTTGADEWWLGRVSLRCDGPGNAWADDLSLREAAGGPELLWEADVDRPIRGFYNPVDCFMLDELVRSAEANGLYLQLCVITRDLYMGSLKDAGSPEYAQAIADAKKLFRYAVARWGYSTSVGAWEYFNEIDPGLPTDRFYAELGAYLEEADVYRHLRTTSTWAPSARDCKHPKLDIAEVHYYLRPTDEKRIRDEVSAVLDRVQFLREHAPEKPVLVGEFGLATDQWQQSPLMEKDKPLLHFHNALWASALSGSSGTVLFWWWDQLDRMDGYHHYRPLAAFLADVPFTTAGLRPSGAVVSDGRARLVGLQSPQHAYLWLVNPQATFMGQAAGGPAPSELGGLAVEIEGLKPGPYVVQWWHTDEQKPFKQDRLPCASGALRLAIPPFAADIACKVLPEAAAPP